jgi:hypothetical protein
MFVMKFKALVWWLSGSSQLDKYWWLGIAGRFGFGMRRVSNVSVPSIQEYKHVSPLLPLTWCPLYRVVAVVTSSAFMEAAEMVEALPS